MWNKNTDLASWESQMYTHFSSVGVSTSIFTSSLREALMTPHTGGTTSALPPSLSDSFSLPSICLLVIHLLCALIDQH